MRNRKFRNRKWFSLLLAASLVGSTASPYVMTASAEEEMIVSEEPVAEEEIYLAEDEIISAGAEEEVFLEGTEDVLSSGEESSDEILEDVVSENVVSEDIVTEDVASEDLSAGTGEELPDPSAADPTVPSDEGTEDAPAGDACSVTEGCILSAGHEGSCQVDSGELTVEMVEEVDAQEMELLEMTDEELAQKVTEINTYIEAEYTIDFNEYKGMSLQDPDGKWSWSSDVSDDGSESHVLTLNNFSADFENDGIYVPHGTTIILKGTNSITYCTNENEGRSTGITVCERAAEYALDDPAASGNSGDSGLTITGEAGAVLKLVSRCQAGYSSDYPNYHAVSLEPYCDKTTGDNVLGNLVVDGVTIETSGANSDLSVYSPKPVNRGGNMILNNAAVISSGDGISVLRAYGDVRMTGSSVSATGNTYSIVYAKSVILSNSTVRRPAGYPIKSSAFQFTTVFGIMATNVLVNDSTIDLDITFDATGSCGGIKAYGGEFEISGNSIIDIAVTSESGSGCVGIVNLATIEDDGDLTYEGTIRICDNSTVILDVKNGYGYAMGIASQELSVENCDRVEIKAEAGIETDSWYAQAHGIDTGITEIRNSNLYVTVAGFDCKSCEILSADGGIKMQIPEDVSIREVEGQKGKVYESSDGGNAVSSMNEDEFENYWINLWNDDQSISSGKRVTYTTVIERSHADSQVSSVTVAGNESAWPDGSAEHTVVLKHGSSLPETLPAEAIVLNDPYASLESDPVSSDGGATWTFTVLAENLSSAKYTLHISVDPTHTFGDWTKKDESTHSRTCQICGHVETESHTGGTADCHSARVCDICRTAYGTVDASNHTGGTELRDVRKESCTENGYTGDTYCLGCGEKIASGEEIPAVPHTWDDGVVTKEPTCVEKGVKTYTCGVCGATRTEELPLSAEHRTELRGAQEPTKDAQGYTGDTVCADCGEVLESGKTVLSYSDSLNTKIGAYWSGSKIKVTWGKVSGAEGYEVLIEQCGKSLDSGDREKTVTDVNRTWTSLSKIKGKKLDPKKEYKIRVRAYRTENGKRKYIGKSYILHVAGRDSTKWTNAKQLKTSSGKRTVILGKSLRVSAKILKENKALRLLSKKHGARVRYWSTNKAVATVSKNGKVTTTGKGTCYIYMTALNGTKTRVKLTVN